MEEKNDWATPGMKEFVFWKDGMTPEEFEAERKHYYEMMSRGKRGEYTPLWKQGKAG